MAFYSDLSKLIFIGNFPELDTDEGASGFEGSPAPIIGTVLSGAGANANVVSFDYDDTDNDGTFEADHSNPGENLTVDGVSSEIDKAFVAGLKLTLDGGAIVNTSCVAFQLTNGDFYLVDLVNNIEGYTVESLEITGVSNTGDAGPISGFQGGGIYDLDNFVFVCFEAETQILTATGEHPARSLNIGDLVVTANHGLQPLRWKSNSKHKWDSAPHKAKPIQFSTGSLGAGLPRRDLLVSPQHRMLLADPQNPQGVFAPAKKLVGLNGVRQMSGRRHAHTFILCSTPIRCCSPTVLRQRVSFLVPKR